MLQATQVPLLDNGYIRLVEAWGSDERIIEAARMSTDKGFQGWGPTCKQDDCCLRGELQKSRSGPCPQCGFPLVAGDEKLLAYLYENKHHTPFEMAGMVIEVQAPIFVFREWHRHRTQSYNELSARYTPLPDVNYVPSVERLMMNAAGSNKQANRIAGAEALTEEAAKRYADHLRVLYKAAEDEYQTALAMGVPKELARVVIPVGRYSRMRASANLRNWLAFLTLRADTAAQWEIRQYAIEVGNLIAQLFPRTHKLYVGSQCSTR